MITVTEVVGLNRTVTVDKDDVAEAIRPWYPEAPTEVTEMIDAIQAALTRHESTYGLEEALGIEIKNA